MESETRDRSPAGRFKYLADRRVNKALRAIESVTKLSDRKNYEYTEEQAQQIVDVLTSAMEEMRAEFSRVPRSLKGAFELK